LKSKLEAIEYGIADTLEEFMYHINYALPDGSEVNLGDSIMRNLENLEKLALPDARRTVDQSAVLKSLDAKFVIKEGP